MTTLEAQHEVITNLILENEKLKRERNEAREAADKWRKLHDAKDELFKKGIAEVERERDEAREVLREIAEASGFENIGNWARNKARKEIDQYRKKNDLLPISWDV